MASLPLQITFRDMPTSDAVRARIVERIEQLEQFHPRIMSCRVVIRAPHRHRSKGRLYSVRIDLKVPRREIVVNREPTGRQAHQDIYVAIRDAFDALDRRLEDTARRRRGDVKAHADNGQIHLTATKIKPASRARAAR
jgi:ribosomal subunit interface protein